MTRHIIFKGLSSSLLFSHFPNGLLALPPNNVPLKEEFRVLPNVNAELVVGTCGAIPCAEPAALPEHILLHVFLEVYSWKNPVRNDVSKNVRLTSSFNSKWCIIGRQTKRLNYQKEEL